MADKDKLVDVTSLIDTGSQPQMVDVNSLIDDGTVKKKGIPEPGSQPAGSAETTLDYHAPTALPSSVGTSNLVGAEQPAQVAPVAVEPPQPQSPEQLNLQAQKAVLGKGIPTTPEDLAKITTDRSQLHQEAYNMAKQGKSAATNAIADIILQKDPTDSYAYQLKAHNLEVNGDYKGAVTQLNNAVANSPNDPNLYAKRAEIAQRAGMTTDATEDATTWLKSMKGEIGEDVSKTRANMYAIKGDTEKSEYWNKTAQGLAEARLRGQDASTLNDFANWFEKSNPVTGPMYGIAEGVDKMQEGVKEGSVAKVVSGAVNTTFAELGYVSPDMALFNSEMFQAKMILPDKVVETLTAPISSAWLMNDPKNQEKLSEWGKLGFQMADLVTFGAYFKLVHSGKDWANKLFTKEPLTPEQAKQVVSAASEMTPADIDNAGQQAQGFVEHKQDVADVAAVQEKIPEPTYRIDDKLVSKEELIDQLKTAKEQGEPIPDFSASKDPQTQAEAEDIVSPKVEPEVQSPPAAEEPIGQKGPEKGRKGEPPEPIWKMTRDEFDERTANGEDLTGWNDSKEKEQADELITESEKIRKTDNSSEGKEKQRQLEAQSQAIADQYYEEHNHELAVKEAVKNGEPVPPEVLADYPDLNPPTEAGKASEVPTEPNTPTNEEAKGETAQEALLSPETAAEPSGEAAVKSTESNRDKIVNSFAQKLTDETVKEDIAQGKERGQIATPETIAEYTATTLNRNKKQFNSLIDAIDNKDYEELSSRLHLGNKTSRSVFESYTGIKLAKTVGETLKQLQDFTGYKEPEKIVVPKMSKEAALQKAQKAKDEQVLSKKFRYDGVVRTRKEQVEHIISNGGGVETKEVQKLKEPTRLQSFRWDNRQQADWERRNKEAGTKTEYRLFENGNGYREITKAEYDYAKELLNKQVAEKPVAVESLFTTHPEVATDIQTAVNEVSQTPDQNGARIGGKPMQIKFGDLEGEEGMMVYGAKDKPIEMVDNTGMSVADIDKKLSEARQELRTTKGSTSSAEFDLKRYEAQKAKQIEYERQQTLEKAGYIEAYTDGTYSLTDLGKQFVDAVDARLETRQGVKAGTDLFPEMANIPEFKAKVDKIKSIEPISDEQIKRITDSDPKELGRIANDVSNQAPSLESQAADAKSPGEIEAAAKAIDDAVAEIDRKIAGTDAVEPSRPVATEPVTAKTEPIEVKTEPPAEPNETKVRATNPEIPKASQKAINYLESLRTGNESLNKKITTAGWNNDVKWNRMIDTLQDIIRKNEDVFNKIVEKIQEFKDSDFYRGLRGLDKKEADDMLHGLIDQYGEKFTGANRAIIDRERAERGLNPVEIEERRTNQQGFDEAKQLVDSRQVDPQELARTIAESEKTPTENFARNINILKYDRMRVENAYSDAVDAYLKAKSDGDGGETLRQHAIIKGLDLAREYNDEALRRLGYEWYSAGKAMQGMVDRAYKLQNITARFEMAKGESATPEELKILKDKVDELEKTKKELDDKLAKQDDYWRDEFEKRKSAELKKIARSDKLKQTKEQLNAERDDLVQQMKKYTMGQANVGIPPELLGLFGKYAVNRAKAGVVDVKIIANEIYNNMKDSLGGLTANDIRDAISGKDNKNVVELPTREKISADILSNRRIVNLTQKLEDIRNGKFGLMDKKARRASTPEEKALETEIKKEKDRLGITTEQAIKSVRTRYENKIKNLQDQIDKGDYTKKPRVKLPLPPDVVKLKEQAERLKQDIDNEIYKQERKNWSTYRTALHYLAEARRFMILSGYHVFGKLGGAAVTRVLTTPIEALVPAVARLVPGIRYFAKRAPRHGRFDVSAEAKGLAMLVSGEPYKQAWAKLSTGKSSLDIAEKSKRLEFQTKLDKILGVTGKLHGFIKEPVRQSEYKRSLEYRIDDAIKNGIDPTDPLVLSSIDMLARMDGNAAIFMNDNLLTKTYRGLIHGLEDRGHHTMATALKVAMPIVKVPMNIAKETGHLIGGMPYAHVLMGRELYKILRDPAYEVSPEMADKIMYNIKKGSVGIGLLALGYSNPQIFGGYYQPGDKHGKDDVPAGGMKIGEFEVPKWMIHNPFIEVLQFGATMRRVHDKMNENRLVEKSALHDLPAGVVAGGKGVIQQIPFADEPTRLGKAVTSGQGAAQFADELAASMLVPQALRDAAKDFDRKDGDYVSRAKYTIGDYIQNDIPFLKNKLPEKGDRYVTDGKDTYNALGENIKSVDGKTWKFIKDNDINVLPPQPDAPAMQFVNTKGEKVDELNPKQYATFVKTRGEAIKQGLDLMMTAMQDEDKSSVIESLMKVDMGDGKPVFDTKKKAEMAYNYFHKRTVESTSKKILSLGTKAGLYNIGCLIRVPGDMKMELAKIIFDEMGGEEPTENK